MRQAGLLFLVAAAAVASGCGSGSASSSGATERASVASFADLVDRVKSGVIRIEVTSCDGSAIATGFLVKPHLVATVEHVVDRASRIRLKRNGKVLGTATVIGADKDRDLALLRTNKPVVGYAFGFAGKAPRLGQDVAALGFPLGLPLTVTKGSVSGLGRLVPIAGLRRRNMVQTDAAVNHGNSGGPLLATDDGHVVGVVDLGSTQANGIAFAVSGSVAAPLLQAWAQAPQPPARRVCADAGGGGGTAPVAKTASPAAYVEAIDSALVDSARTRGDLGDLISAVNDRTLDEAAARGAISAIIDQRRQLLETVSDISAPAPFTRAAQLLHASIVAALSDDLAIENWIKASYRGDKAAADRYWQQQLGLSERASAAKKQFLSNYNAKRRTVLRLPALDVAY